MKGCCSGGLLRVGVDKWCRVNRGLGGWMNEWV